MTAERHHDRAGPRIGPDRAWWLVAAALLPLLVFAAAMVIVFNRQQQTAIERLVRQEATVQAGMVQRSVREQLGVLSGLAASTALDRNDFNAFRIEAQRLWDRHPDWTTIVLTDRTAQLVNLRLPAGAPPVPIRDPKSLERVWTTQNPGAGNLVSGTVALRVPVIREGATRFTLTAGAPPDQFRRILDDSGLRPGWGAAVLGSDGVVITGTGPLASLTGRPVPSPYASLMSRPFRRSLTVNGDEFHAAAAPIGRLGWQLIVTAPVALAEQSFLASRWAVWLGALAASGVTLPLLVSLTAMWASRREAIRVQALNQELSKALGEKDVLLQEVYHRVKNNLQLVEALMALQSRQLADSPARDAFLATRRRIFALGLVHQQLLQSPDLATFSLGGFIAELCQNLAYAAGGDERSIMVATTVDDIPADLDFAIPLGLLVNELVSNALRHAFPDGRTGTVEVTVARHEEGMVLTIADNGIGSTNGRPGQESTGTRIVNALVAQLHGTMTVATGAGTTVRITMPLPERRHG